MPSENLPEPDSSVGGTGTSFGQCSRDLARLRWKPPVASTTAAARIVIVSCARRSVACTPAIRPCSTISCCACVFQRKVDVRIAQRLAKQRPHQVQSAPMRHVEARDAVAVAGGDAIEGHADRGEEVVDVGARMGDVVARPVLVRILRPRRPVAIGELRRVVQAERFLHRRADDRDAAGLDAVPAEHRVHVEHQHAHATAGQVDRRRQAGEAGADDHDLRLGRRRRILLRMRAGCVPGTPSSSSAASTPQQGRDTFISALPVRASMQTFAGPITAPRALRRQRARRALASAGGCL